MKSLSKASLFGWSFAETFLMMGVSYALLLSWYPDLYFQVFDLETKFSLLVLMAILVGPVLSLIIYKKQQIQLVNDLTVIALIKYIAIFLALFLFYSQRPLLLVFAVDRFVVVQAHQVPKNTIPPNVVALMVSSKEPPLVAARLFDSANLEVMMEVLSGAPDIEFRPSQYELIKYQTKQIAEESKKWLTAGREAWMMENTEWNSRHEAVMPLPLVYGNDKHGVALINVMTSSIEGFIDVNPW